VNKAILVLNAGSSSIKFGIYTAADKGTTLHHIYRGQIEGIGEQTRFVVHQMQADGIEKMVTDDETLLPSHESALAVLLDWLDAQVTDFEFIAVGHRVVHGGELFSEAVIVDAGVFVKLESLVPLAPLHQPHNLAAIEDFNRLAPELMQIACFDTAFHRTMPDVAQRFALPYTLTEKGIRPYGFHGLSYEYIASVLPEYEASSAKGRVIVAHLGHGASLCAMVGLRSVATTMAFTPLDGLPMATRCGTLDPGVVLYLMTEFGMTVSAVSELLNNKSGLLGMSGISGDMRELLASSQPRAAEAVDQFVYRVAREIGSLAAAAGGLDTLVFTGGIGEHSSIIRQRISQQLAWLGVDIDPVKNAADNTEISSSDSPVSVWTIPANEELVIAQHTFAIAQQAAV